MNRSKLMELFKEKFKGEYAKENGKWYWSLDTQKKLVSNAWLSLMLKSNINGDTIIPQPQKDSTTYEIPKHEVETLVEDGEQEESLEEQKSKYESTEFSEKELKKIEERKMKRKARRDKRKQEKSNEP